MKNLKNKLIIFFFLCFFGISAFSNPKAANFLVITDVHLDKNTTHAMEIEPFSFNKNNDLDLRTLHKLLRTLTTEIRQEKIPKPQFVLLLGDLVGHHRHKSGSAIADETQVFMALKKAVLNVPILYVFGNNDSLARDYGVFRFANAKSTLKSPYDIAITSGWKNGFLSTGNKCSINKNIFPCLSEENTEDGYYVAYLQPKFRFIGLNSVLFSVKRQGVSAKAIKKALDWFENELRSAEKQNESVLIAMHVPVGKNIYDHSKFWNGEDEDKFLKILGQTHADVVGILAGHTHFDETKVLKNGESGKLIPLMITPGLSTSHGNSPAIKTYYFNKNSANQWRLTNYVVFNFSNMDNNVQLKKLYDYSSHYCHGVATDINDCLTAVNIDKIKTYYTAGNIKCAGKTAFFYPNRDLSIDIAARK